MAVILLSESNENEFDEYKDGDQGGNDNGDGDQRYYSDPVGDTTDGGSGDAAASEQYVDTLRDEDNGYDFMLNVCYPCTYSVYKCKRAGF